MTIITALFLCVHCHLGYSGFGDWSDSYFEGTDIWSYFDMHSWFYTRDNRAMGGLPMEPCGKILAITCQLNLGLNDSVFPSIFLLGSTCSLSSLLWALSHTVLPISPLLNRP